MSRMEGRAHVLIIRPCAPDEVFRRYTPEHVAYLDRYHAAGIFKSSGSSTTPGYAGVIVAEGVAYAEVTRIVEEDPYVKAGVAAYQIITVEALSDRQPTTTVPTE